MATQTWYMLQLNVGGTNPNRMWYDVATGGTQTTAVAGWTVGKIAANNYSSYNAGVKQGTGTFSTTIVPNNTAPTVDNNYPSQAIYTPPTLLNSTDSISTLYPYNGYFPAGTWTFSFPLIATVASTQDGSITMRVFKAPRSGTAFGTTTELTSAMLTGTAVTNLSTTAQTSTVTWSAPAFYLNNEFLIIKLAFLITGAGGSNTADVLLRYGLGCTMVSPAFRDRRYAIT